VLCSVSVGGVARPKVNLRLPIGLLDRVTANGLRLFWDVLEHSPDGAVPSGLPLIPASRAPMQSLPPDRRKEDAKFEEAFAKLE
jgi:hypothetical protein